MKTSIISLNRKALMPAVFGVACFFSFTSCSDDLLDTDLKQEVTKETSAASKQTVSNKVFINCDQRDVTATVGAVVRFDGSRAAVSAYNLDNEDPYAVALNADVIYTKNDSTGIEGYFKMDNGSKLSFTMNNDMMSVINMPGASNVDEEDNECILTGQSTDMASRGDVNDLAKKYRYLGLSKGLPKMVGFMPKLYQEHKIFTAMPENLTKKEKKAWKEELEESTKGFADGCGLAADVLGEMFDAYNELEDVDPRLEALSEGLQKLAVQADNVRSAAVFSYNFDNFTTYKNNLRKVVNKVNSEFSMLKRYRSENDKKTALERMVKFSKRSTYGPADIESFIRGLMKETDSQYTHFHDIDAWAFSCFNTESDSRVWAEMVRAQEYAAVVRCVTLLALASTVDGAKMTLDDVDKLYCDYATFFNEHAGMDESNDNRVITQINGAYLVMDKQAKVMCVDKLNIGCSEIGYYQGVHWNDKGYIGWEKQINNTYEGMFANNSMKSNEADAIVAAYKGNNNMNIFTSALGIEGISDTKSYITFNEGVTLSDNNNIIALTTKALSLNSAESVCDNQIGTLAKVNLRDGHNKAQWIERNDGKYYNLTVYKRFDSADKLFNEVYRSNSPLKYKVPTTLKGEYKELTEAEIKEIKTTATGSDYLSMLKNAKIAHQKKMSEYNKSIKESKENIEEQKKIEDSSKRATYAMNKEIKELEAECYQLSGMRANRQRDTEYILEQNRYERSVRQSEIKKMKEENDSLQNQILQ